MPRVKTILVILEYHTACWKCHLVHLLSITNNALDQCAEQNLLRTAITRYAHGTSSASDTIKTDYEFWVYQLSYVKLANFLALLVSTIWGRCGESRLPLSSNQS